MRAVNIYPPDPPAWMYTVPQGTFDRRVLDQPYYWVTRTGEILEPIQLSRAHLRNILSMLEAMAPLLHMEAMLDVLVGPPDGLVGEMLAFQLTGSCLGTVSADSWLESTSLVRALRAELAGRDVIDPDPDYCRPITASGQRYRLRCPVPSGLGTQ